MYESNHPAREGVLQCLEHVFASMRDAPCDALTVCDSAFDIGQRFVSVWQLWRRTELYSKQLHYLGFEPTALGPVAFADLCRSLASSDERMALTAQWITPLPGVSRLEFEGGRVSLTLFHMPLKQAVLQAMARVDVFLLAENIAQLASAEPGFSLFGQLARLSAPEAVVLVPACSGQAQLERGLQRAGFVCETVPAFGLSARLRRTIGHAARRGAARQDVAIVGAGIAGAGAAYALALRGHRVHVFDPVLTISLQGVHHGHLGAAVTPVLSRDDDFRARLSRAGARTAWQRWRDLPGRARPQRTGTAVLATDVDERRRLSDALMNASFPEEWVRWCDTERLGPIRQPFAYFSEGMVIRPNHLIEALLRHPQIELHAEEVVCIESDGTHQWCLRGASRKALACVPNVVLATAARVLPLLQASHLAPIPTRLAQIQAVAGQVSYFDATRFTTAFSGVVDGDGYWLPPLDGQHVAGGTYMLDARHALVTAEGHAEVVGKVCQLFGGAASEMSVGDSDCLRKNLNGALTGGWAGWRAVVPGRLPVIGELDALKGVWVACAYGSRGLTWSALAGEIIACVLNDEPIPLERELLRALAPR